MAVEEVKSALRKDFAVVEVTHFNLLDSFFLGGTARQLVVAQF